MLLFFLSIVVTLVAVIVSHLLRRRERKVLYALAREWGMHYSAYDVFNLAPRVAAHLPVIGASDVLVRDLIYGMQPAGGHRYIFCAEYTAGVVRSKNRRRCVACVIENAICSRATSDEAAAAPTAGAGAGTKGSLLLQVASADLPFLEQYRSLSPRGTKPNPD